MSEVGTVAAPVFDIALVRSPHNICPHPYAYYTHMNLVLVPVSQLLQSRLPITVFHEFIKHQLFGHLESSMQQICRRCKGDGWCQIHGGKSKVLTANLPYQPLLFVCGVQQLHALAE